MLPLTRLATRPFPFRALAGLFLIAALGFAPWAQTPEATPTPAPAATPVPAATPAPPEPPSPAPPNEFVMVPYDGELGPRLGAGDSVLVPYAKFLRLKTDQPKDDPDFKPTAALASATYVGEIVGDVARFEAELAVETIARPDDRFEIDLAFQNAAVERASVEGAEAFLAPREEGAGLRVAMKGEGRRVVKLAFAVALATNEEAAKILSFDAPRAAAASLELKLNGEAELRSGGDLLPATLNGEKDATSIRAACGSREAIRLSWRPKLKIESEAEAAAREPLLSVEQEAMFRISSRSATGRAKLRVEPLFGAPKSLAVQLPAGVRPLRATGSLVAEWSAPDEKGAFSIALNREAKEAFEIVLDLEILRDAVDAPFEAPEILVGNAARQTGALVVDADAELSTWPETVEGLETVTGMGASRAYRYAQPGWKLAFSIRPVAARVRANSLLLYEATEDFVRLKTRHDLAIAARGLFDAAFEVPEGFELREAGPADLVAGFRQRDRRVELTFRGERRDRVVAELRLERRRGGLDEPLKLLPVSVVGAEEDEGNVALAAPLALRATETSSSGLQAADARTLLGDIQPLLGEDLATTLAYRYFSPRFEAGIAIERQRSRATCETNLLASVEPALMRVNATLNYNVEFSGVDEFQLMAPASVGEAVRFNGADIKEKKRAAPAAGEELTTWTLRLQRKALGPWRLGVSFDVPLDGGAEANTGKPVRVALPKVHAVGVARETGHVGVSRGENQAVGVARSPGLEGRDVKELPGELSSAFLGFRYFDPSYDLELELTRHQLEGVLGAVARRVHVETVVSDEREAIHEVFFVVQNNREQYLELKLPKDVEIWAAFVAGASVRSTTRESDGARLIELAKSSGQNDAFRVRLVLKEKLDGGGSMGWWGGLALRPPEPLNIPVLRLTWKCYLPREYEYIDFGGSTTLETGRTGPPLAWVLNGLLNDGPADIAGGLARRAIRPNTSRPGFDFDTSETPQEREARLRGAALDIPIVKEGKEFVFSKVSGMGDVEVSYAKRTPFIAAQLIVAGLALAALLLLAFLRKAPWTNYLALLVAFLAASLADGWIGRLLLPILAAAALASAACFGAYAWKLLRAAFRAVVRKDDGGDGGDNPPAGWTKVEFEAEESPAAASLAPGGGDAGGDSADAVATAEEKPAEEPEVEEGEAPDDAGEGEDGGEGEQPGDGGKRRGKRRRR